MKRFVPTVLAVAGILLTRTFSPLASQTPEPQALVLPLQCSARRLPAAARVAADGGNAQRIRSPEARRNCWLAHDRKKRRVLGDPARPW